MQPKISLIKSYIHHNKQLVTILAVITPVCLGIGLYLANTLNPSLNLSSAPKAQIPETREKMLSVVKKVSTKISLPTDEEPMLATVSDKEKLQNQDFFKEAQNGDKVLMYKKAQKAYLYRPSTDIVIAEAPLQFGDTPTPQPAINADDASQSAQDNVPQGPRKVLIAPLSP